jgi:hypothetical protein
MSGPSDLIIDCATGQWSHTKIWANIAYACATVAFLRMALFSDTPADSEIWLIYLGVVGTHSVSSKLLSLKYGAPR